MQKLITRANERGSADHGWLKPNHYFSFGGFHDPSRVHFGALRVINDDFIAGGGAFPTHPHDNMEIITIPFTGALQHKDSTGGKGVIKAGDVQIMSAGSGVRHSESNASATDPVTLFQIWIFPKERNITPRYDQRTFGVEERKNAWQTIVSPIEADNALDINQDAKLSVTDLEAGKSIGYTNSFPGSGMYIIAVKGAIKVGGEELMERDSVGISGISSLEIEATEDAEILLIEVPMEF